MLEPTLACNIACIGCGKIREYESNKARLTVDECVDAGAPVSGAGRVDLRRRAARLQGIEDVVAGMLELGKNIDLCTNALRLEQYLDVFKPSHKLTFVVHLDGMREIHDYICDYPGLWDIAVDAIKKAREAGFRVSTNTTIFKETSVDDVLEMMGYLTNEVGIDGMLIAPGYQYSQIDPALTMTRAEHEEKFRIIRKVARQRNYRWLASPIYQEFLTGERKLNCAPWGSITRNPYGWKGPVLPADGRDLSRPTTRCSRGSSGRSTAPGTIPAASTAPFTPASSRQPPTRRRGPSRRAPGSMAWDADGLTFACAMTVEERIARRLGRTAIVGLGASKGIPQGRLVSFGIAGALSSELPIGTVIDATRVVDESGAVLWGRRPARGQGGAHRNDSRRQPDRRRSG
jgi:hopanoid biosynthesis associated radical SAM protein HpnH